MAKKRAYKKVVFKKKQEPLPRLKQFFTSQIAMKPTIPREVPKRYLPTAKIFHYRGIPKQHYQQECEKVKELYKYDRRQRQEYLQFLEAEYNAGLETFKDKAMQRRDQPPSKFDELKKRSIEPPKRETQKKPEIPLFERPPTWRPSPPSPKAEVSGLSIASISSPRQRRQIPRLIAKTLPPKLHESKTSSSRKFSIGKKSPTRPFVVLNGTITSQKPYSRSLKATSIRASVSSAKMECVVKKAVALPAKKSVVTIATLQKAARIPNTDLTKQQLYKIQRKCIREAQRKTSGKASTDWKVTIRTKKTIKKKKLMEKSLNLIEKQTGEKKNFLEIVKGVSKPKKKIASVPPTIAESIQQRDQTTVSPFAAEEADGIFKMMMDEAEGIDLKGEPGEIVKLIVPFDGPTLAVTGNAVESLSRGIITDQVPVREINALSDRNAEKFASTIKQQPAHTFPVESIAAKRLLPEQIEVEPQSELLTRDSFIQHDLLLHSFQVETYFQARGSIFPTWFPGIYTVLPEESPKTVMKKSPSEVLHTAWQIMKPKYGTKAK